MSDEGLGEATAPAEAVPDTTPAEAPAAEEHSILDTEPPAGMRSYTPEHMAEVRDEAAKHRIAAREAKARVQELEARYAPLEQYNDTDRDTWLNLANNWLQDPNQTAADFRTIANNVLGDPTSTTEERAEAMEALDTADQIEASLTPDKINELVDERLSAKDAELRQEQAIADVHSKIAEAGYPQGTADNFKVLWVTNNDPAAEGDLDKAIEIVKGEKQQIIDEYIQTVRNGGVTAPAGGVPGIQENPITSMEDAAAAAKKFLNGREH